MSRDVLWDEIVEQPQVLLRQIDARNQAKAIADALRSRNCDQVKLVGHGSSDNAATYGVYVLASLLDCRRPVPPYRFRSTTTRTFRTRIPW